MRRTSGEKCPEFRCKSFKYDGKYVAFTKLLNKMVNRKHFKRNLCNENNNLCF